MKKYLEETPLLDFSHPSIRQLMEERGWPARSTVDRVRSIYEFVRDEIRFGYNLSDDIPASRVLADGYGQCNTKSTLLMALLRGAGIPNRIHGFTIGKALQKGAVTGIWYRLAPREILHSWVEVRIGEQWYFLEGVILDKPYLAALQKRNADCTGTFCGFGVYTENLQSPAIDWDLNHTRIQDLGINRDFGLFDSPDAFYALHRQEIGPLKRLIFRLIVRRLMNRNVSQVRNSGGRN